MSSENKKLLKYILILSVAIPWSLQSPAHAQMHVLNIVAHQDDDILFLNPDIADEIMSGATVETIFVTAGNAPDIERNPSFYSCTANGVTTTCTTLSQCGSGVICTLNSYTPCSTQSTIAGYSPYWQQRETAILAAYAQMAGVSSSPSPWTQTHMTAAGANVYTMTLAGGRLRIIFLRLNSYVNFLEDLWNQRDSATHFLGSADNNLCVAGEQLIEILQSLIQQFSPTKLQTLNSSELYNSLTYDHLEHIATSRFAVEAYRRLSGTHSYAQYRGYDMYSCNWNTATNTCSPLVSVPVNLANFGTGPITTSGAEASSAFMTKFNAANAYFGLDTNFSPNLMPCVLDPSPNLGWCNIIATAPPSPYAQWLLREYTVTVGPNDPISTSTTPDLAQDFVSSDFGDADLGRNSIYYNTFRLASVTGNGVPTACIRRFDGVRCATQQNGQFLPHVSFSADFSRSRGWDNNASYGSTLQFADINHDGKDDICGRGSAGIGCALANSSGTGFLPISLWTGDFSDNQGWGSQASYYNSIRLADVNGDSYPDVCGRGVWGIACGLNNKSGGFSPVQLWITSQFADAQGWSQPKYGTTVQFGDLNGDGKTDVCARGMNGIVCALSNGSSFGSATLWTTDFSDSQGWGSSSSYYSSLRLVDINGDGKADICGHGVYGIVCALSKGTSFTPAFVYSAYFADASGWSDPAYGSTIQFSRQSTGGVLICGRGKFGLECH